MIDEFMKIFEGLDRAYGQFKRNDSRISVKVEGKPWVEHKPLQRNLWENHLRGIGVSLGIFPLTDDGTCKGGAIDIDVDGLDYEELLKKIRELKLPLIMFRSKSGRAHVYLFMKNFTSAEEVRLVMKKFASKLGLADKLDRIYPMQTELGEKETGSWLNLPYFNHEEGSRYAYKDDFDAATIEEFFEMHKQYAQENLDDYLLEEIKLPTKKVKHTSLEELFLPCHQNSLQLNNNKIPTDIGRNDFLLHSFVWAKRAQTHTKKIEEYKHLDSKGLLKHYNKKHFQEPLSEDEIEKTIFKSEDKEYKYLCTRPKIKKYCDPSACVRHTCGITQEQALELVEAEESLGNITQYCSDPPIFYENVAVKKDNKEYKRIRIEMDGSFFLYKDKYLTRLANAGHFPHDAILDKKSPEFRKMNLARLAKRNYEKAAEESTPEYEFKALIQNFLNRCTVSIVKSHLLDGACYYNQETKEMEIRIHKLMDYLKANRDFRPVRKLTFDLKHLLKAKKVNGYVKNIFGKEKSCPTWRFKEDRENFIVTINQGQKQLQIKEKNNEEN